MTKKIFLNTYFLLFVISLIFSFINSFLIVYPKESIGVSEFLINYQGGFVRRGLLGEILLHLHNNLKLSPYYSIITLSIFSYIGIVIFFVKLFIKNGYTLFILPFVFFLGNR